MSRKLLSSAVVALTVVAGVGVASPALACVDSPGDDAREDRARLSVPPRYPSPDVVALDAELEGQIVIRPQGTQLQPLAQQSGADDHTLLLAVFALAAPAFTAASVGVYVARSRRS